MDKPISSKIVQSPASTNSTLIRQSPFFSSLPSPLVNEMAEQFRMQEWNKGEYINPKVILSYFFMIFEGQVEMKRYNPESGREVTLDMLFPGDSFDVITLLDEQPHDIIIVPLSDLKLIATPITIMRKWLWTYPELNKQFLPYLANKMREQENMTTNLVLHDVTTRLSRIILKHVNQINTYTGNKSKEHQTHLVSGLTDEALARMVGSVRQVINKQLQYWKSQGIIDKKRNQIIINDLDALYKEAKYTHSSLNK